MGHAEETKHLFILKGGLSFVGMTQKVKLVPPARWLLQVEKKRNILPYRIID